METYEQRYERTSGWVARHLAQDFMLMAGKDAIVSEHDEQILQNAEQRDAEGSR